MYRNVLILPNFAPSNLRSKKQDKRGIEIGKNLDSLRAVLRDYVRTAHWNLKHLYTLKLIDFTFLFQIRKEKTN